MKLTPGQLRRIIKEEVMKQKSINEYGLGASASSESIEKAKAALDALRIEIENNLADVGNEEEDIEDMAAEALVELFKEFMDGIGYRYKL